MRWKLTLALAATLLAAGCTRTTGTAAISACALWQPISWSRADTPRTVEEVKIQNARRAGFCDR